MRKSLTCKVGLVILLSVAFLVNYAAAAPVYNSNNGHYYELVLSPLNWDAANIAAQSSSYQGMNGHLATFSNQDEEDFISTTFANGCYWLGGYLDSNMNWQWVTGETWSYTYWANGEPNNAGGQEDKICTWPFFASPRWDAWNDLQGYSSNPYIIEYEPTSTSVPEFPTVVLPIAAIIGLAFIFQRKKE